MWYDLLMDDELSKIESITLSNGDLLLIVDDSHVLNRVNWVRRAWRIRDGKAITMVRFFTAENSGAPGYAVICDVEVRTEYRGVGLGIDTVREIESHIGSRLHTSGSFTPKGFRSLSSGLAYLPGTEIDAGIKFNDMFFVNDWNCLYINGYTLAEVLESVTDRCSVV